MEFNKIISYMSKCSEIQQRNKTDVLLLAVFFS